jgi:putative inorganic carbon (hco3(-)) transporter
MYPLIAIYCLLFVWLSHSKTNWALYLIVVALPSYLIRFQLFNVPFTLLEAMILLLFLVVLFKKQIKFELKNIYTLPIVAILIFATISIFKSTDTIGALGIWKAYFIEPVLLLLIFTSIVKNKIQLNNIFKALGLSVIYLSLIAFWQYFSGWNVSEAFLNINGSVDRVTSIFSYPNALGLYIGPIIIIFTGLLFQPKDKIFKFLVIALGLITIVLAKSEAALLAILAIWAIWGLLYKKTRIIVISIIVIGVIFLSLSPQALEPISDKVLLKDYSGYVRRLIYLESWEMLKDNWFLGGGLNNYRTAIVPYHLPTFEYFMYPHNIIFNFWTELGILGLLSFIWLLVVFLWQNIVNWFKNKNILNLILVFTTFEIIIHGLVDVPYFKNDLAVLFWVVIGISILINKKSSIITP